MNSIVNKLPVLITGLMLGLAVVANLIQSYSNSLSKEASAPKA